MTYLDLYARWSAKDEDGLINHQDGWPGDNEREHGERFIKQSCQDITSLTRLGCLINLFPDRSYYDYDRPALAALCRHSSSWPWLVSTSGPGTSFAPGPWEHWHQLNMEYCNQINVASWQSSSGNELAPSLLMLQGSCNCQWGLKILVSQWLLYLNWTVVEIDSQRWVKQMCQ